VTAINPGPLRHAQPYSPGAHTVSMEEFRQNFGPLPDYASLDEMVTELAASDVDLRITEDLVSQLYEYGAFRTPIRVEEGVISNGCHRFCALVAAGAQEISIWVVQDGVYEQQEHTETDVVLEIENDITSEEAWESLTSYALIAARSLPLGEFWLESDGAGLSGRELTYTYYADVEAARRALPTIVARLAEFEVMVRVLRVEECVYDS
jgi:hypothetical protein